MGFRLRWQHLAAIVVLVGSLGSFYRQIGFVRTLRDQFLLNIENEEHSSLHPHRSMFTVSPWETSTKHEPLLRVYVYDNLPARFTSDIEECMLKRVSNISRFAAESTKMADLALIKLFKTYPGRVYNPDNAELFVVPYPHTCHCLCADGWQMNCGQVPEREIDQLFDTLSYYNDDTAAKHVFLLSGNQYAMNERLREQELTILGGYLEPHQILQKDRGRIVIPYLNDKADFQKVFDKSWWNKNNLRDLAFAYIYGPANTHNSGRDPRRVRVLFQNDVERRNMTALTHNMPFAMQAFDSSHSVAAGVWKAYGYYERSIFCPVLAGDSCQQARFFDVMMKGCIPVVLNYNSNLAHFNSWYTAGGESTVASLPFHKDLYDTDIGIDYTKCVLQVNATRQEDVYKLVDVMEDMILKHPDEIRGLQENIRTHCAPRVAFGMGHHAHPHQDAFRQIELALRYYLDDDRPRSKVKREADIRQISETLGVSASQLTVDLGQSLLAQEWSPDNTTILQSTLSSSPSLLKIYVYDSLPERYTSDVDECLAKIVTNATRFADVNPKLADLVLIRLFQTFPGRVDNPNDADFFVVPYSHTGHCVCSGRRMLLCGQVPQREIDQLFDHLVFYNQTSANRHIFLMSDNQYYINRRLTSQPLKLRGGYLEAAQVVERDPGTIIVPHMNDRPSYQDVFTHSDSWWTRKRKFAFGYVARAQQKVIGGGRNPMRIRTFFRRDEQHRRRVYVAGKAFFMDGMAENVTDEQAVAIADHVYENSIFCPMLAAGTCQQAQFFDAMMKGCIPVVLNFADTNINTEPNYANSWAMNETSWYRPKGDVVVAALPFNKGLFGIGVDYNSCVLQVNATSERDVTMMIDSMEEVILRQPERQRNLQLNLKQCASSVAYGMGEKNAHKHPDAFSQVLLLLRHYLDKLEQADAKLDA